MVFLIAESCTLVKNFEFIPVWSVLRHTSWYVTIDQSGKLSQTVVR